MLRNAVTRGVVFCALVIALFFFASRVSAIVTQDFALPGTSGNMSTVCANLWGIPANAAYYTSIFTPQLCAAELDLLSKYEPGSCSEQGQARREDGIAKLNPSFAMELDKMLNDPYMQGVIINSAYRTPQGEACANSDVKNSSHIHGCAADLNYPSATSPSIIMVSTASECGTVCQWVQRNAGAYGLQERLQYAPEYNHIEPLDLATCKSSGPPSVPTTPPTSAVGGSISVGTPGYDQHVGVTTPSANAYWQSALFAPFAQMGMLVGSEFSRLLAPNNSFSGVPAATPAFPTPAEQAPVSSQLATTSTSSQSAIDLINALGTTGISTTPIIFSSSTNVSTQGATQGQLQAPLLQSPLTTNVGPGSVFPSTISVVSTQPSNYSVQTVDNNGPVGNGAPSSPIASVAATLNTMKQALVGALSYLTHLFGR